MPPGILPADKFVSVNVDLAGMYPPRIDPELVMRVLQHVEIGEPIKSLFGPRLWFDHELDSLMLKINAPDALHPRGIMREFTFTEHLPPCHDEKMVLHFVRQFIVRAITHEVDEALRYHGQYVNDPHPVVYPK